MVVSFSVLFSFEVRDCSLLTDEIKALQSFSKATTIRMLNSKKKYSSMFLNANAESRQNSKSNPFIEINRNSLVY